MSTLSFVLLVALLTFAIGLGVAAIIWVINLILSPEDQDCILLFKDELKQVITAYNKLRKLTEPNNPSLNYSDNKELYNYHHGKD
jgi:hypothetical protein